VEEIAFNGKGWKTNVRKRIEAWVMWNFILREIQIWQVLEKPHKFLSASAFNLY
jgi:hypothetical protein